MAPERPWPLFSQQQADFLQELYPLQMYDPGTTSIETYLQYRGARILVEAIASRVAGPQGDLFLHDQEDDALDILAERQAVEGIDEPTEG